MTSPEGEREFWRRHLAGRSPLLALATDRPRPATPSRRRGSLRVPMSTASARAPQEVLVTAFTTLLHHYTGQHDLLVGCVDRHERTGVLRADLSGDPTFGEL